MNGGHIRGHLHRQHRRPITTIQGYEVPDPDLRPPDPGGPLSSRWCPSAAAIVSATRASCCPLTSARSTQRSTRDLPGAAGRA